MIKRSADNLVAVMAEKASSEESFEVMKYVNIHKSVIYHGIVVVHNNHILGYLAPLRSRQSWLQRLVVRLIFREENLMISPEPWKQY